MGNTGIKRISQLSIANIRDCLPHLEANEQFLELWELAKCTPPQVAVRILAFLGRQSWKPEVERSSFEELVAKAMDCERRVPPFQRLTFKSLAYEELTAVSSYSYQEDLDILIAVHKPSDRTILRVWSTLSGRVKQTIVGPSIYEDLFAPLQLAYSPQTNRALSIHIGGSLYLWDLNTETAKEVAIPGFSASTNARPFSISRGQHFIVCGEEGKIALIHDPSHDYSVREVTEQKQQCIGITGSTDKENICILLNDGSIVEIEGSNDYTPGPITHVDKNAHTMTYNADDTALLVGTRRGEIYALDLLSKAVDMLFKHQSHDSVSSVKTFQSGKCILTGHFSGFSILKADDSTLLLWVPRHAALPAKSAGELIQVTGDQEHALFLDAHGKLRVFSPRFAIIELTPCANLTMEDLAWIESKREDHPEWMDFVSTMAIRIRDGELDPHWEYEIPISLEETRDGAIFLETPPKFEDGFGALPGEMKEDGEE